MGPLKHTWPASNKYGPYIEAVRSLTPGPGQYRVPVLSNTKDRSELGWGAGNARTMPNLWAGATQQGKTWHEKQVIDKTLRKDRKMRLDWCEHIRDERNMEATASMEQIRHFERMNGPRS
jgi:hypothetical protein